MTSGSPSCGPPAAFAEHPNVTRIPVLPMPASADTDAINATQALIETLEAHLTPTGPTQDPDWYGWIPLRHDTFLAGLLTAHHLLNAEGHPSPDGRYSFLDVGSGIGTKLIIAHELGYHPCGVERWGPYVEVSRRIVPYASVWCHDAATLRTSIYGSFDLIGYYGCAPDQKRDGQIKQRIADHMRPGAILFTTRKPYPTTLEPVADHLYRKPGSHPR